MANKQLKTKNKDFTDCSHLRAGMIVPNYNEMCKLLGEAPKENGGNSRKAQIKRWERYFNFEKKGYKYIIQEIYEIPAPNTDARQFKEGVYIQYVECILEDFLSRQTADAVILSKTQWCHNIGLMGKRYSFFSPRKDRLLDVDRTLYVDDTDSERFSPLKYAIASKYGLAVDDREIDYFYDLSSSRMYSILDDALNSMERRGLIEKSKMFEICMKDGSKISVESNNEKLYKEIFRLRNLACRKLGFGNFQKVKKAHLLNRYYATLQSLVRQYHTNNDDPSQSWVYIKEYTKIFSIQDVMKRMLLPSTEKLFQLINSAEYESELSHCRKELSNRVTDAVSKDVIKQKAKYDNEQKEIAAKGWGEQNSMNMKPYVRFNNDVLSKKNFLEVQNSLIDYLIRPED